MRWSGPGGTKVSRRSNRSRPPGGGSACSCVVPALPDRPHRSRNVSRNAGNVAAPLRRSTLAQRSVSTETQTCVSASRGESRTRAWEAVLDGRPRRPDHSGCKPNLIGHGPHIVLLDCAAGRNHDYDVGRLHPADVDKAAVALGTDCQLAGDPMVTARLSGFEPVAASRGLVVGGWPDAGPAATLPPGESANLSVIMNAPCQRQWPSPVPAGLPPATVDLVLPGGVTQLPIPDTVREPFRPNGICSFSVSGFERFRPVVR